MCLVERERRDYAIDDNDISIIHELVYRQSQKLWRQKWPGHAVGDFVKITSKAADHESGWPGVWHDKMTRYVGETGQIAACNNTGIRVKFSDGAEWCFPFFVLTPAYTEAQKNCGLRAGDRVRVTRRPRTHEYGWNGVWYGDMDKFVGMTGVVEQLCDGGIKLRFKRGGVTYIYGFPFFVLEEVEDAQAAPEPASEFLPFDKVLVRDEDNEPWAPDIYSKHTPDVMFPHNTFKGRFKQCIPYEGNERLAWKTEAPDWE